MIEGKAFLIGSRWIGTGHPCFIIAEAGVNHNGDVELAKRLVDAAAESGADAVKFQTFKAEKVVGPSAPKADYQKKTTGENESQLEMIRRLELSEEAHRDLKRRCEEKRILFLSTPFDEQSADELDSMGVELFKISSGDLTNWPLLEHIAAKGKAIVLSTGMSWLSEVAESVRVLEAAGCEKLVLLHCVSSYPADPADCNLRSMQTMKEALGLPVGYSDHTLGTTVPVAAVALGACILEKHFTLDRNLPGPDHRASLSPLELKDLVAGIRAAESALGDGLKKPAPGEIPNIAVARRSLAASRAIAAGESFTRDNICCLRPGTGIPPRFLSFFLGRKARRPIPSHSPLDLGMIE